MRTVDQEGRHRRTCADIVAAEEYRQDRPLRSRRMDDDDGGRWEEGASAQMLRRH